MKIFAGISGCKEHNISQFRKLNFSIFHIQQNNVYESEMLVKAVKRIKWSQFLPLNEVIDGMVRKISGEILKIFL